MGFPGSSAGKESACDAGDPSSIPGLGRYPGEGIGYPLKYSWASLVAQTVKNLPAMGRPGLGTSPGGGQGNPVQYSCLENPVNRGAWWATFHGVAKSRTQLSDFTFTFHFHALEKEMATHSRALAWRIPGTAEPGGLPSMGLHRVGHN